MKAAVIICVLVGAAVQCGAQVPSFSFSYRGANSGVSTPVQANGAIAFPSTQTGFSSSVMLNFSNQTTTTYRILDTTVQGSYFTAVAPAVQITPSGSLAFPVTFTPTAAGQFAAYLTVRLTSTTGSATQFVFSLEGVATAPASSTPVDGGGGSSSVIISYMFADRGNNIPLAQGETLPFPSITAATRLTANIVLTNKGSSTTTINSVSISGSAFELTGLPLLPATVIAGGELRFNVAFLPPEGTSYSGELRVTTAGQLRTFSLSGRGLAGAIVYELLDRGVTSRITSGSTLVFPAIQAGGGSTILTLRVRNTGDGDSRLGGFINSGPPFALLDQPSPPIVLKPGEDITVRIQFTPLEVGDFTGTLRVDPASFPLSGRGMGAKLTTWMLLGEERFLLRSNARGVIPNTEVGARRMFTIELANTGDEPAPISAAQISGEGFNLLQLPPMPMRIAPGQSLLLTGVFAPVQVGAVIGFLVIQDLSFQMLGVGSDPPSLPDVKFLGLPENPLPLQQPALALELSTAYPYDLTGILRMTFANDAYVDDPAVQFLNGQRSIEFRIPANSRRAVFGSNAQEIRLQTGSLSGAITIVAQISTGRYDLTRATPPVAVMNLAPSAPVIRTVELVARASKSFELVITGAVTSRTLSRFNFKFTPKTGSKLQTNSLAADVSRAFESWFQSANSRPYGGQFRASFVFDLTADFGAIDTVEVTATNSLGTSAARVVKVTPDK